MTYAVTVIVLFTPSEVTGVVPLPASWVTTPTAVQVAGPLGYDCWRAIFPWTNVPVPVATALPPPPSMTPDGQVAVALTVVLFGAFTVETAGVPEVTELDAIFPPVAPVAPVGPIGPVSPVGP